MAVSLSQVDQDSYSIAVLSDLAAPSPQCETQLSLINVLEVPKPLKHSLSLDAVVTSQNKVNRNMENVDVYFPCIADIDLEEGSSEKLQTKNDPTGNVKIEDPLKKTSQKQISIQMGEKIMQMLIDHTLVSPKFSFRDKTAAERVRDMPNNKLRKYKRSTSFNSRKVVLLFSVLSCLGTMVLIMLTLRVRQMADSSRHG